MKVDTYTKPTLTLVGAADEVVLGAFGPGSDFLDEFIVEDAEFQDDDVPAPMG
jgi:hypothetical protein